MLMHNVAPNSFKHCKVVASEAELLAVASVAHRAEAREVEFLGVVLAALRAVEREAAHRAVEREAVLQAVELEAVEELHKAAVAKETIHQPTCASTQLGTRTERGPTRPPPLRASSW